MLAAEESQHIGLGSEIDVLYDPRDHRYVTLKTDWPVVIRHLLFFVGGCTLLVFTIRNLATAE
ncbi:hypothetical protein DB347_22695 [Opitutaceae bacterium EW11]|nr:hypothetical protein DB347_22695 [Opitutaceae bacterium EW11]